MIIKKMYYLFSINNNKNNCPNLVSNPIICPVYFFIIIVILLLFWIYIIIYYLPSTDRKGLPITYFHKYALFISIFVFYILFVIIFGLILYNLCLTCNSNNTWGIIFLVILLPIFIAIIIISYLGYFYGPSIFFIGNNI